MLTVLKIWDMVSRKIVGSIKHKIGELRTDISWVIDNPAFFDNYSPVSTELFETLANWDDMMISGKQHTTETLSKTSKNIEKLFEKAKADSEKIGFEHLHGKSKIQVERASKLVHKAKSTNSSEEHDLLMSKAAELLSGIMEIILPKQAVQELERYNPTAIEQNSFA